MARHHRDRVTAEDGFNFAGGWCLFVLVLCLMPVVMCCGGFGLFYVIGLVGGHAK